jgi:tRNA pseudouridine38-40 synthase
MGTLSLEEFQQIVNGKKQVKVKRLAVPNGLYLSKVEYPYLNITTQNSMCELLKSGLESE